jgi:hypothetical protein
MFGRENDGVPPMAESRLSARPRCSISCRAMSVTFIAQRRTRSSSASERTRVFSHVFLRRFQV